MAGNRGYLRGAIAAALAASAWGCGAADGPPPADARVRGKVTRGAGRVTEGRVRLYRPTPGQPQSPGLTATIGRDGTYELAAPTGRHVVEVSGRKFFFSQEFDVQAGTNTLDLKVPWPPGPAR